MDAIQAVFLDVGETIVDESREYGDTFQFFKPGFDLAEERRRRVVAGQPESWGEDALYPDARPCLEALRATGLWTCRQPDQGGGGDPAVTRPSGGRAGHVGRLG